ncbi:potassium transporter [Halobacteriales archaeon QH_10_67_13]|nr:MAG: potassium transporter [Halobacteriales archaeon QH_10_67_13]
MSQALLPIIAGIFLLGILAQLLSRRLKVPSVLFLIGIGVAIGGSGLGIVDIETFSESGLSTIVGLSVAIIVFDGAFQLRRERLREASTTTLRLVTIGAVLTLVGVALSVRVFLGESWELSFLVGALLVATGPTVITPILEIVDVREHVASAMEAEGVINDVSAAIAAAVIFEAFVVADEGLFAGAIGFAERIGIGVAAGALAAGTAYYVLSRDLAPGDSPQVSRYIALAAALGGYALADGLASEAGVAAAATAGLLMGNFDLRHREEIEEFARDVTLLVLGFVFIALGALIDINEVLELGLTGIALVAVVMLVVRPLAVVIATAGVPRFSYPERAFLSTVAPRGIIPASVATLFAIELQAEGSPAEAQALTAAVFLVIFATVVLEGGFARQIGSALSVTPMDTIIVGGGRVGRALAKRLEQRGESVVIIDNDETRVEEGRAEDLTVREGDGTDASVLRTAGIGEAKRLIAATGDDDQNLLIAQMASTKFGLEDVLARVNDPDNMGAFEGLNVRAIDASTATAFAIDNEIERPSMAHWMDELGEGHDVQECTITSEDYVGKTIEQINKRIPDGVIIAIVCRDGDEHVPNAGETLNRGDRVTFVGDNAGVKEAVRRFNPQGT